MKEKTTFKRWDSSRSTASFRDFYDIEITDKKHIEKDNFKKDIVTIKVSEKSHCPALFSYLWGYNDNPTLFTGTTVWRSTDEYNELTGMDIAEHKALAKAYKFIARRFEKAMKEYMGLVEDCHDFLNLFTMKYAKQQTCWKKLGNVK